MSPTLGHPVPAQCFKGVVFLAVPYLGLISMLIPYPWNYALVGLILLFIFLSELRPLGEGRSPRANAAGIGIQREQRWFELKEGD